MIFLCFDYCFGNIVVDDIELRGFGECDFVVGVFWWLWIGEGNFDFGFFFEFCCSFENLGLLVIICV